MKAISIGHYVGAMGNAVLEQQNFIKKLLNTLQLIKPQSNEFTNQLNKLVEEYEATRENISFIKQEISTEKNYKIEFEKEENTGAIYRAVINEK